MRTPGFLLFLVALPSQLLIGGTPSLFLNIEAMQHAVPESADGAVAALVLGYHTPNDGGGGLFYWRPAATSAGIDFGNTFPSVVAHGSWIRCLISVVTPQQFGAYGDGFHDDTDALQRTINSFSGHGGTITLPPGQYLTHKPIELAPGIALQSSEGAHGNAPDQATLVPTHDGDCLCYAPEKTSYANIRISHITIAPKLKLRRGSGIRFERCHDIILDHVAVGQMPDAGFWLGHGCWSVEVSSCYAGNNAASGYYIDAEHVNLDGATASDGGIHSVLVDRDASAVLLSAFNFEGATDSAVLLHSGMSIRIINGVIQNTPIAISDAGMPERGDPVRVIISNNRFWGSNHANSVGIVFSSHRGGDVILEANQIYTFDDGIRIGGSAHYVAGEDVVYATRGTAFDNGIEGANASLSVFGGVYFGHNYSIYHHSYCPSTYAGFLVNKSPVVAKGAPQIALIARSQ